MRSDRSESERDSAVDVQLVGVLCVADEIAAPVRVAPPAGCIGLDICWRPTDADPPAHALRAVQLDAGAPRARVARHAVECARSVDRLKRHRTEAGGAKAAEQVRA